jgi:hypothetical protein
MLCLLGELAVGACFDPQNPYREHQRGKVLSSNSSEVRVEVFDPQEGKKSRAILGWSPGTLVKIVLESEFQSSKSQRHPYNHGASADGQTTTQDEGEGEMSTETTIQASPVTKTLAVRALQDITQRPDLNPEKMELKVVQSKMNALKKVPREELHEPEDPVLKDIFNDALSEGGVKVLEDDGSEPDVAEEPEAGKGEKASLKRAKKSGKKAKAPKAESNGQADASTAPAKKRSRKPGKKAEGPPKERKPREGVTLIGAAIRVLREHRGKGLSAKEMVEKAVEKGYWPGQVTKESIAALASPIYHEIKHKPDRARFCQPEKGVFNLTEIGKAK